MVEEKGTDAFLLLLRVETSRHTTPSVSLACEREKKGQQRKHDAP